MVLARCSTRSTLDARGRADPHRPRVRRTALADGLARLGLYLATAVGQPVIGRLVDAVRPRRLYLVGTALVGVAGSLSACSPRPCGCWSSLRVLLLRHLRRLSRVDVAAAHRVGAHRTEEPQRHPRHPVGVLPGHLSSSGRRSAASPSARLASDLRINVPPSAASSGPRRAAPAQDPAGRAWSDARAPTYPMALFAASPTAFMLALMGPGLAHAYLLLIGLPRAPCSSAVSAARAPFLDLRVLGGNGPPLATYARQLLARTPPRTSSRTATRSGSRKAAA